MFGFGLPELLIIFFLVFLLFGRRLPELGDSLGRSIRNFRKQMRMPDAIDITPDKDKSKDDEPLR